MEEIIDDIIKKKPSYQLKVYILIIWILFILLGIAFSLMNWPGKNILILFSTAGFSAYSFSGFLTYKGSHILNSICTVISLCWLLVMLFGIFFNNGIPFNRFGLILYIVILVAFTTFYEIIKFYRNHKRI